MTKHPHPCIGRSCWESPYYSPEHFGLEIVGTVEVPMGYEFDMFVIWMDKEGRSYYWASDSGCSCPTPFEDTELVSGTARDVMTDLDSWADTGERLMALRDVRDAAWMKELVKEARVYG